MNQADAQSIGAVPGDDAGAATRHGQTDAEGPRTGGGASGGWFERFRESLGLRGAANLREDLEHALSREDALDAAFSPEERAMLRNILRLGETRVDDVMVPRADIDSVDVSVSLADLVRAFKASGHSRMPVYRETLDDPIGMVHIKDLMAHIIARAEIGGDDEGAPRLDVGGVDLDLPLSATDLVRPILFVPPSMPAADLLAKMQATRIQIALVIDEYGGTDGLVSMEDIVETIVGDISDEHDEQEGPSIVSSGPGAFVADARTSLEEVVEAVGSSFRVDDYGDDVDTIGGLLFSMLGRIPVRGEIVTSPDLPGFEFEVLDADPRRIRRVRILERAAAGPAPAPDRRKRRGAGEPEAEAAEVARAAE
mgnify:CR=1 FL=1